MGFLHLFIVNKSG